MTDFETVEAYLNRLQMFGIKLGLDNTKSLFDALSVSWERMRFLHIAGSNGKGSTGAMLASMLQEAGFKVGFYTSPHLISPRERIRIDGKALSEAAWCAAFERVRPGAEALETGPTYFEYHTAMAVAAFDAARVDFVVWETGMGGRLDATNAIPAQAKAVAIITGIALEHQQHLGGTLAAIAQEKAGIILPGVPVFAGVMPEEALQVIRRRAEELQVSCTSVAAGDIPVPVSAPEAAQQRLIWHGYEFALALPGAMQRRNAALALAVTAYLGTRYGFALEQALPGLARVKWPARLQELPDGTWVDGGHNPDGIRALTEALQERCPGRRFHFIFGAFADKDTAGELALLAELADGIVFVPIAGAVQRPSRAPEELARCWREISDVTAQTAPDAAAALKLCPVRNRVVCGSLFLAGDVLRLLLGPDAALDI